MAEPLDRDTMIHLLNRLGSEDDADVLDAAHYLHERVMESGRSWNDLLAATFDAASPSDCAPAPARAPTGPAGAVAKDSDPLTLIETLLARPDISEALRGELEDYRSDIAEGEFADSDRRYLVALYERLT